MVAPTVGKTSFSFSRRESTSIGVILSNAAVRSGTLSVYRSTTSDTPAKPSGSSGRNCRSEASHWPDSRLGFVTEDGKCQTRTLRKWTRKGVRAALLAASVLVNETASPLQGQFAGSWRLLSGTAGEFLEVRCHAIAARQERLGLANHAQRFGAVAFQQGPLADFEQPA